MGFSISGIAINRNLEDDITDFFNRNGLIAKSTDEEIDFLDAMDSDKGAKYADVFFSDQGTVIFLDQENALRPYFLDQGNVCSFDYHENAMAIVAIVILITMSYGRRTGLL